MASDLPEAATALEESVLELYVSRFRSLRRQHTLERDRVEYERRTRMNRRRERKRGVGPLIIARHGQVAALC